MAGFGHMINKQIFTRNYLPNHGIAYLGNNILLGTTIYFTLNK